MAVRKNLEKYLVNDPITPALYEQCIVLDNIQMLQSRTPDAQILGQLSVVTKRIYLKTWCEFFWNETLIGNWCEFLPKPIDYPIKYVPRSNISNYYFVSLFIETLHTCNCGEIDIGELTKTWQFGNFGWIFGGDVKYIWYLCIDRWESVEK